MRQAHSLDPDVITAVHIRMPAMAYVDRPHPKTGLEGKFSFQYTAAVALLDGRVTIESFTDTRRFAPDMQALLPHVHVSLDPSIPTDFGNMWVELTVRLRDGRELKERCDRPHGLWSDPLSRGERIAKFNDCARRVLSEADTARCIGLLDALEELDHVRELMDLLRADPTGPR